MLTFGTYMLKWKVFKSSIVYFTETYTNKFFSKKTSPKSIMEKGVGVCEARFGIYHISFFLQGDAKDNLKQRVNYSSSYLHDSTFYSFLDI